MKTLAMAAWAAGLSLLGLAPALAQTKAPLTILRVIDADRYDPVRSTATAASEIIFMLADTLVSLDFDMKTVKPFLAKSWTASEDGRTYTFDLRQDVKFCDGRPMTAEDVVYSLKRWIDPATRSPVASRAGKVKDIRATDDHTVVYELQEPFSDLLYQLTQSFGSIVDKNTVEKLGQNFGVQGFNATGPYCWVSWTPRQDLVMKKNPHYTWGPPIYKNPKPEIDQIVWKVVPEANTLMAAMQARQADITYYPPLFSIDTMQRVPGLKVQQQKDYIYDVFFAFRVNKPVASDPAIRRAASMAVNKDAIAKAVYFGHGTPLHSLLSPTVLDYDAKAATLMPTFDPAGAAKVLDEAGWTPGPDGIRVKDGQKASFLVYGIRDDQNPRISEAMQADLRKVGIEMRIQLWDATVAWGKLATQEFDAFMLSYPYGTATEALNLYFKSTQAPTPNRMNWKDEKTDQLIDAAATATDPAKRKEANAETQRLLTAANVWIPLVTRQLWVVSGDRVEGVRPHGLYGAGLYKGLDLSLKR
ncbi:peptide/nickel transport system substrate-binding protein [Methylobacterium sp. 174MFSha1.1]|uniref:ABC transporter substrate-binding protein n=1 Tax=Methylobacterium sp. 174MFSha1.1 TaxID=1502749 RepID=UPI0008E3F837|nr:ABC transporter substrate-binding protein [Methylobacterium sp. 174MFSha1.1]SFU50193.1 peptide/nickel transport system substrate-binding protein [Methylobacterium sp. 174MFSha1.1]